MVFYGCFHSLWKPKYHHGFAACEYVLFLGAQNLKLGTLLYGALGVGVSVVVPCFVSKKAVSS